MRTLLLVLTGLAAVALPAFAVEQTTYTDEDLERYNKYSTYDEETMSRSEADLKRWEKEREVEERLSAQKRESDNRRPAVERAESGKKAVSQEITKAPNKNTQTIKKGKT